MRIPREYETPLLLGVACALLAGVVSGAWLWKVSTQQETRARIASGGEGADEQAANLVAKKFELPPPVRFDGIVERPLFISGRRPPPPPPPPPPPAVAPPPPPPPPKPLEAALHGVVFGPDGSAIVLLKDKAGKRYRFGKGEGLEGWVVTEIARDRIVMVYGETRQELLLQKPKPKEGVKVPPPPPVPAKKPSDGGGDKGDKTDNADDKRKIPGG